MNNIIISLDETHHIRDKKPLYSHRFDKVQSFHFPLGYAPVINNQCAFFINLEGRPVFGRNFKNAFGFYNGIATVVDNFGFFHIDEQGRDIYCQRFTWSGNFQEGLCVVDDIEGNGFFHIDKKGNPAYTEKYAYVGDFRYGVAVVTSENGFCTHINNQGQLLHGKYFLELDVYHKGYAIAKDEVGYFHINKSGKAIYNERYIKLEPYYNNRAIAINKHGTRLIISIKGGIVKKINSYNP
jgi:hypothetical protein